MAWRARLLDQNQQLFWPAGRGPQPWRVLDAGLSEIRAPLRRLRLRGCSRAKPISRALFCAYRGQMARPAVSTNSGISRRWHQLERRAHSMTSSARTRNDSGIFNPIALAVFRLMTRSNLVGCSNGMSAGFAPRRILSTYSAARRNILA